MSNKPNLRVAKKPEAEPTTEPNQGNPVASMVITVMDNGMVNVQGFPMELNRAMGILNAAQSAVVNFFMEQAMKGKLTRQADDQPPLIVVPQMSGIPPLNGKGH